MSKINTNTNIFGLIKMGEYKYIKNPDSAYRKERESYINRKFNSFYKGINRIP